MVLTWTFSQQTRALFKRWSQVCTILSARGRARIGARSMSRCHTRTTGSTASGPLGKIWVTSIDCKKVTRSSLINTKRNFKVWMHQGTGRFKISLNQISPSVHVCLLKQVTAINLTNSNHSEFGRLVFKRQYAVVRRKIIHKKRSKLSMHTSQGPNTATFLLLGSSDFKRLAGKSGSWNTSWTSLLADFSCFQIKSHPINFFKCKLIIFGSSHAQSKERSNNFNLPKCSLNCFIIFCIFLHPLPPLFFL